MVRPDWQDLHFFSVLARHGQLSAAAKALEVEHTTVARRVTALEASLGVQLFHRTSRGYLLTAEGERIRAVADRMQQACYGIDSALRPETEHEIVTVRIATIEDFATHWLAPHLPSLRQALPSVRVEIRVGARHVDLARGEADIAIRVPRPKHTELTAVRLARAGLGLYASPELARRLDPKGRGISPKARQIPLLVYFEEAAFLQHSSAWFADLMARADIRLRANTTGAIASAAVAGHGVGVLPHLVARTYGERLRHVGPREVGGASVWMVTHPQLRKRPEVAATCQFVKRIASELAVTPG